MPIWALPQDRLPTRKEWFAPADPASARKTGPVPRSHAAVLRGMMDMPVNNDEGQEAEVWRVYQRLAGYFLAAMSGSSRNSAWIARD